MTLLLWIGVVIVVIAYNQQVALNKLKKSLKSPQETVT